PVPARIAVPPAGRIAMQFSHTCAETRDGVYCWGADDAGQLGRLTTDRVTTPSPIAGLPSSIVEVEVRSRDAFGCARTSAGEVWCWGQGIRGVTGNANRRTSPTATQIALPFAADEIAIA